MLYRILKLVMKIALRLAYRRIVCTGLDSIENGKPVLILANHSASFMDAILMGVFLKRRIHFFTRGDVFKNPVAAKLLRSLGMLPVFRVSEGKELMHRNEETNAEALKVLASQGAVLIFAEGVSALEKMLKPLKKGPFRLAALAAEQGIPPVIVPVGINYISPEKAEGDIFLVAGEVVDTALLSGTDGATGVVLATNAMRAIYGHLQDVVWNAKSLKAAAAADVSLRLLQAREQHFSFAECKAIISALNDLPDDALNDFQVGSLPYLIKRAPKARIMDYMLVLMLFPFAFPALLFHYIPILFAQLIAKRLFREPDFYAPVFLCAAVILIVLWYFLAIAVAAFFLSFVLVSALALWFAAGGIIYRKLWKPCRQRVSASLSDSL